MRWSLLFLIIPSLAFGQKFTISGYVKDSGSSESLIGAAIVSKKTLQGTAANVHGFYSITLPADSIHLVYSFVGYAPIQIKLLLRSDTTIDIGLINGTQLDEVVVSATR